MSVIKQYILVILVSVVLAGCAPRRGVQPGWISEPHAEFPADRFMVGVASGESCDEAIDRAIARISQQIEVRVNATEQRHSLMNSVASLGSSGSFTFESDVHLASETTLLGVEIVETRPLSSGSCAARAVLNIDRSIVLYDEAIGLAQAAIRSSLDRADGVETRWQEFIAVSEALHEAIDLDVLVIARSVLASRASRAQPPMTLVVPTLVDRYDSLRKQISISVVPIGDCPIVFIDAARANLSGLDLPLKPDYFGLLQIRIGWQISTERTFDPRWWSSRWRLSVTLYDSQLRVTIASSTPQEGSAYGLSEDAAHEQALLDAVIMLEDMMVRLIEIPGSDSSP